MLIDRVKELEPDVLGLLALLTTTMPEMEKVVQALQNERIRGNVWEISE
jgi:5-methyltetrahydrofolate--homocysteine methyltransferase